MVGALYASTANAAYDTWFTLINHPDGHSHTAHVLHDGTWDPSQGTGSYILINGVKAIWIDGFDDQQKGWSKEALDVCFAMAMLRSFNGDFVPCYIEKNRNDATPIDERQWVRETRLDNLGNSFTSHWLKHKNILGVEWYDYARLSDYATRKALYLSVLWSACLEPARAANTLSEDEQLAEVKRYIATGKAVWSYLGQPELDLAIRQYTAALQAKQSMEAADVEQYIQNIAIINGNADKWAHLKQGMSALSLLYDGWNFGTKISTAYQVSKLYHQLVVLDEVEERIAELERIAAANPAYDPAFSAAVAEVRSNYTAMTSPTAGGSGPIGWIAVELSVLHDFQATNPDDFNKMVRDGIKLTGTAAKFAADLYLYYVAGASLSAPAMAAIAGAFIVWDSATGLLGEWEKMDTAAVHMNVDELLRARLIYYRDNVNFSNIDYNLAKGVCLVSSMASYCGSEFYDIFADLAIDPDAGVYYLLKGFVLLGQLQDVYSYRDKCLQYKSTNLCSGQGLDMGRNLHYLPWSPHGDGITLANYLSYLTSLESRLVCDRPRTTPTAVISSITPPNITRGSGSIVFNGGTSSATTPGATLATYRWNSSINGQLYSGTNLSFARDSTTLSAGQHTIMLQVQDSNGLWSENAAQGALNVYEPGPDKGHDLAVNRIDLDKTIISVNGQVRTDVFIENQGTNTESGFSILYRLLNNSGGVLDQKTNFPAGSWSPGQNKGPGYVYLSSSGGYSGLANVEVTVQNTLDEDRSDNSRTAGIYVGVPPTYDGYVGGSWTYIYGTGDATESGYALALLNDYGGSVRISITKGSTWTATMSPDQFNFFDANKFAVLYIGKQTGTPAKYGFAMFINNTNEAWLAQKIVVGDEGGTGTFTNKRASSSSTACDDWYISSSGQGATVAAWSPQGQKIDNFTYKVTVSPPLDSAGYYEFWFKNCVGFGLSPTVTTRTGPAMAMRAAITVNEDRDPDTSITSCPTGTVASRTVTAQFSGSDDRTSTTNLTYSYRLTGYQESWSSFSLGTSVTYSNLSNGTYGFEVKAKDNQGQIDLSPAQRTFMVDVQTPPGTPNNTSPSHGGILRPTQSFILEASVFSDPDPGASHSASEFRARTDSGNYTTPAWTSGVLSAVTSCPVQLGTLPGGTKYWWQCRYRDNTSRWGEWSGETSFTLQTNYAPTAYAVAIEVLHDRMGTIQLPVFDADGDSVSCQTVNPPIHGSVLTNTPISISYTPTSHFVGADSFTFKASDGLALSSTQTVTISVVNHAPVANSILAVVESGKRTTLALPAFDADADSLNYFITANPASGVLFTNSLSNGSVDYQSVVGFNDTVSIGYSASDGLASGAGTLTLMVSDPNTITVDIVLDAIRRATIQYPSIAGRTYTVQYCNTVFGPWSNLVTSAVGDGSFKSTPDTSQVLPVARFYRVVGSSP